MSFCSNCGAQADDSVRYCPRCGQPATGPAWTQAPMGPAASSAETPAPRGSRRLLWLALATVVLLIAGGGGGYYYDRHHEHSWPAASQTEFLQACQATGGGPSYCTCGLKKLRERYSYAQFRRFEARLLLAGQVPVEITDVIGDCVETQEQSAPVLRPSPSPVEQEQPLALPSAAADEDSPSPLPPAVVNGECSLVTDDVRALLGSKPAPGVHADLAAGYLLEGKNGDVVGGFISGSDDHGLIDGLFGSWYIAKDGRIFRYTDAARTLSAWPQAGNGAPTPLSRRVRACAEANAG